MSCYSAICLHTQIIPKYLIYLIQMKTKYSLQAVGSNPYSLLSISEVFGEAEVFSLWKRKRRNSGGDQQKEPEVWKT